MDQLNEKKNKDQEQEMYSLEDWEINWFNEMYSDNKLTV